MKKPWIHCNNLLAAIEVGDIESAAQVIDNGFDIDTILLEGKSAISICIERGSFEMAQLLISRGCSLSLKSPKGEYPLHLAVTRCDANLVQLLLRNRADVTSIDLLGRTALHIACEMNVLGIAKLLAEKSTIALLNAVDRDGRTPLMYACKFSSSELVNYLLFKGCRINVVNTCGETPLFECIDNEKNSCEVMLCLLNAGADVHHTNIAGETPLLRALHKLCIFRVGQRTNKFLMMSMLLIEYESDLKVKNFLGQSPLHLSVSANNEIITKKILNAGCNVDARDKMGFVPMFYACRNANKVILDLLIKSGANLQAQNWHYAKLLLQMSDSCDLIDYIIGQSKQVISLSALCRRTIRKHFTKSIDKYAKSLHLPTSLIKYIQFDE